MNPRIRHAKPKKLNSEEVRRMKEAREAGVSVTMLAERFRISRDAVQDYLNGLKESKCVEC
jgi:DNA invertase Pin-like site-specific DNA recombinase